MSDWQDDYETNPCGVDPSDYSNQDDFMDALRNNERRMNSGNGQNNNEGCYIATCVYGSYDAPEVLTLRRFRDCVLKKHVFGRAFIRAYYATSPTLVRLFGERRLFRKVNKGFLDRFVSMLKAQNKKQND